MTIELRTARGAGERALFIGNTGSGKTVLIQTLAAPMSSVVVMDSKGDNSWVEYAQRFGYVVSGDPADIRRHHKVIHRVDTRSLADREGWNRPGRIGYVWTEALQSCWYRTMNETGVTLVIFDEGIETMPSKGGGHPEARRIFTSGRTQGLPSWLGAQVPLYVDPLALSQAEHCFSFKQPLPEYRDLLRVRRGVQTDVLATLELDKERHIHEFAHHHMGEDSWTEFGTVQPVISAPKQPVAELATTTAENDTSAL